MPRKVTLLAASCAGLDPKRVTKALLQTHGNVSAAAKILRVPVTDFRMYCRADQTAVLAAMEAEEAILDRAEQALREGMESPDPAKRLIAAAHILRTSPAAWRRGHHSASHYAPTGDARGRPTKTDYSGGVG